MNKLEALKKYIKVVEEKMGGRGYEINFTEGRKYWKITYKFNNQTYVHSFVDRSTGDILKAATWNVPAKGIRGSILNADNGRSAIGDYGANYLR